MLFKFNTVKTVSDPHERRQRLARLYTFFEKAAANGDVSEATPKATAADQPQLVNRPEHGTRPARAGQVEVIQ